MPDSPNHLLRFRSGRGLPSADLSRDELRDIDRDLSGRSTWGALMPQSREERRWYSPANETVGDVLGLLPPVAAYRGGQRAGQGWAEGDPLNMALGVGQIGLSLLPFRPGARTPPATGTSGPSGLDSLSTAALLAESRRVRGEADRLIERAAPGARTPPPRTPIEDFHALQPGSAFPRLAGTSAVDARNAQLALRQANGNYDDAVGFLNGNFPGAESLLRAWQARGVDTGQALRYWQGLAGLRDLERPTRLNALLPHALLGAGVATNPPLLGD